MHRYTPERSRSVVTSPMFKRNSITSICRIEQIHNKFTSCCGFVVQQLTINTTSVATRPTRCHACCVDSKLLRNKSKEWSCALVGKACGVCAIGRADSAAR